VQPDQPWPGLFLREVAADRVANLLAKRNQRFGLSENIFAQRARCEPTFRSLLDKKYDFAHRQFTISDYTDFRGPARRRTPDLIPR
jgi:hypothetical protein